MGVADPKFVPSPAGSSGVRVDPLVGRLVAGKYRVVALIGRGGMGNVYRATQEPLERDVAIKVLKPDYPEEQDPHFVQRFFLEANAASKLHHPNTITVYDYGRDEDVFYIVMELLEGRTLRAMMKDVGPVPAGRAVHVVRQIAKSLREAHQNGLVHRDMKPSNVILIRRDDDPDFVKVLDFGLVKFLDSDSDLTKTGTFMGSPKYMAPEQIRRGRCDVRTDVYSVGVLTYQILCTMVPFDGESVSVLMHHLNDPPPRMKEQNPAVEIPVRLERAVMRCLEKDPDRRFQTMDDLLDELGGVQEELFGERSVSGRLLDLSPSQILPGELVAPPTVPGATTPTGTRRGWLVPLIAATVVVFLGAGITGALVFGGFWGDGGGETDGVRARPDRSRDDRRSGKGAPKTGLIAVGEDGDRDAKGDDPGTATTGTGALSDEIELVVELRSEPSGADVFEGDRRIGLTPLTEKLRVAAGDAGRARTFEFKLPGKKPVKVTARPLDGKIVAEGRFVTVSTPATAKPHGPKKPGTSTSGDDYKDDPY